MASETDAPFEGHPLGASYQKDASDEPPPYESVIINDDAEAPPDMASGSRHSEPPPAGSGVYGVPTNPDFTVTVTDPVKQGDGVGMFVSYKIVSTVVLDGYRPGRHEVIRRFRDFTWLKNRLRSQYMGVIVPALPEKSVVEKFKLHAEFIEHRRAALGVFLNRVAAHAVLRHSPDLRLFLQANETDFAIEASRTAAEAGDPAPAAAAGAAGAARKTLTSAARLFRTLSHSTGAASQRSDDQEEDAEYLRMRDYMAELEGHLEQTHRQAARLVRLHADLGAAVAEFGTAMAALGRHEEAEAGPAGTALSASFSQLGDRSGAVAAVCRRSSEGLAASFEAPLKEFTRSVRAAKKAMADRADALAARQAARAEVDARRARLAKLRATPGMREERIAEAERDLRAASGKAEAAAQVYTDVVERMGGDLGRFQRERAQEMGYVLRDFAQAEAAAAAEMAKLWRSEP